MATLLHMLLLTDIDDNCACNMKVIIIFSIIVYISISRENWKKYYSPTSQTVSKQ